MLIALVLLSTFTGLCSFALMASRDQTYVPSEPYSPTGVSSVDLAVVYYSRSGHSEAVAREIARSFNARIVRIEADSRSRRLGPRDGALCRLPLEATARRSLKPTEA